MEKQDEEDERLPHPASFGSAGRLEIKMRNFAAGFG
jgi:hypothetical protein